MKPLVPGAVRESAPAQAESTLERQPQRIVSGWPHGLDLSDTRPAAPRDPRALKGLSERLSRQMAAPPLAGPEDLDNILTAVRARLEDPDADIPAPLARAARLVLDDEIARLGPVRERVSGVISV